jgi:hypothetical protein
MTARSLSPDGAACGACRKMAKSMALMSSQEFLRLELLLRNLQASKRRYDEALLKRFDELDAKFDALDAILDRRFKSDN